MATTTTATSQAKKDLRKKIKSKLSNLTEGDVSLQSRKAQEIILSLAKYNEASSISIFLNMPTGEAQTNLIVQDALTKGKKVFVPYIHRPPTPQGQEKPRRIIDMLRLPDLNDYTRLERDSWGIPSLPMSSISGRENACGGFGLSTAESGPSSNNGAFDNGQGLDMIVMPGMAFDHGLRRLGHGGGFYDGFLSRFCGKGRGKPYLGRYQVEHFKIFRSCALMHCCSWTLPQRTTSVS